MRVLNRRSFVKSVGIGAIATSVAKVVGNSRRPAMAKSVRTSNNAKSYLPEGMLDRFTKAPVYESWVTHSTGQLPVMTLPEDCTMKVYPRSSRTTTAMSTVILAEDLSSSPNQYLVQKLTYDTPHVATVDLHRITQDAVDILAGSLIVQPRMAETDMPTGDRRRFEYFDHNGFTYALQVERRVATIVILRVGRFGDPHWEMVESVENWAFQTDFTVEPVMPVESGWRVGYGPFDFHPSAYEAPDCLGP